MITLSNITKRFGTFTALNSVSLSILPHSVHGLLGENGAGKSTLMNILFGLLRPDSGSIQIANQPTQIRSPRIAQTLGIGMVHQHFKLVPTLTVAQNFALSLHASVRAIKPRAAAWATQLHWQIPLDSRIDTLSVGQQQRIEIIKALLATESQTTQRTLILDEPTAVLTPQESAELFAAVRRLKAAGTAIIFISHKLAEVQAICDTITILRRGQLIHTGPLAEITPPQMAEKMVGQSIELPSLKSEISDISNPKSQIPSPIENQKSKIENPKFPILPSQISNLKSEIPPVLLLSNLSAGILHSINLSVLPGEIVGIAGVDGNGQSDLIAAIIGSIPITAGSLTLAGQIATHAPIRWRIDRLAFIPQDRQTQAMILPLSIRDNLLLKDYRQKPFSTRGWLHFPAWRSHARNLIQQFDIRAHSLADPAASLSGGNQQKMVLARELSTDTSTSANSIPAKSLILAANPTRGLDIGATAFVLRQLLAARARRAAILLIHSDLDELLAISDRILVLFNGTLTPVSQNTKEAIGPLMLGLKREEPVA